MNANQKGMLIFEQESYLIRGAVYEVYQEMGSGFLEAIYQECLLREFELRNVPYVRHPQLDVSYKGNTLPLTYVPDFICYDATLVELIMKKATTENTECTETTEIYTNVH